MFSLKLDYIINIEKKLIDFFEIVMNLFVELSF